MPCIWNWTMSCEGSVSGAHYMQTDMDRCYLCEKSSTQIEAETMAFIKEHFTKRKRYA